MKCPDPSSSSVHHSAFSIHHYPSESLEIVVHDLRLVHAGGGRGIRVRRADAPAVGDVADGADHDAVAGFQAAADFAALDAAEADVDVELFQAAVLDGVDGLLLDRLAG